MPLRRHACALLVPLAVACAVPLSAQTGRAVSPFPARSVALTGGILGSDMSNVEYVPVVGSRANLPLVGQWLSVEGALSYAPLHGATHFVFYEDGVDAIDLTTPYAFADVQLQATLPIGRLRPYVGVGAGALHRFRFALTKETYVASIGARAALFGAYALQADVRLRGWYKNSDNRGFGAGTGEFTLGVARGF